MHNVSKIKILFVLNSFGMAFYIIFSRLYFNQAGLSNSQIGVLFSIPGFILIFSQPLWSGFTDYFGSARRVFQVILSGTALLLLVYYLGRGFFLDHFLALGALFVVFSLFYTGRGPARNSLALVYLDEDEGENQGFGGVRLWMSIGWSISAVAAGWFFLQHSLDLLFPIASGSFLLSALFLIHLPLDKGASLQNRNLLRNPEVQKLLSNRDVWIYIGALFLLGIGTLGSSTFLPIYIKEVFKFSTLTLGTFYAVGALAEVPFFYYGDRVVEKVGLRTFLIGGFVVQSLIWIIFSIVITPIAAFLVWAFRGMGYSFIVLGSVLYLDREAPPEARTIGQSVFITTFFGISAVVGRTTGGWVADLLGLSFLYMCSGILGLVAVAILTFYWSV